MWILLVFLGFLAAEVKGQTSIPPDTASSPTTTGGTSVVPPGTASPPTTAGGTPVLPPLEITHTVTFEIDLAGRGNQPRVGLGNITIALFRMIVPNTVDNFLKYAKSRTQGTMYEGRTFHRIIKGFIAQGGDLTGSDGRSGFTDQSLWFPSENFELKHVGTGWVSMANAGKQNGLDTNGSQFFITLAPTSELDGLNVVFGKVIEGMPVVRKMENVDVDTRNNNRPVRNVIIKSCKATDLQQPFPTTTRQPAPEYL